MEQVEPITDYLKRRLREAGASKFEEIAEEAGVTVSFIRKFVYGSRENPRVQTVQPLLDYFAGIDRGAPSQPADRPTMHLKRKREDHTPTDKPSRRSTDKAGA